MINLPKNEDDEDVENQGQQVQNGQKDLKKQEKTTQGQQDISKLPEPSPPTEDAPKKRQEDSGIQPITPLRLRTYGQQLQYERRRKGWKQERLAKMMGVTVSEVRSWENNLSYPGEDSRWKLAELLRREIRHSSKAIYRKQDTDEAYDTEVKDAQLPPQPTPATLTKVQGAQQSLEIFFCYAREDEALLNKLKTHLRPLQRQGLIDIWHDRDISAGTEWEQEISKHLNKAQIILLLVSPDFMNSEYCYGIEMKQALERHQRGEARVIPIIVRHVYWRGILGHLQALPTDANPVMSSPWYNDDEALFNVTEGIRKAVEEMTTSLGEH